VTLVDGLREFFKKAFADTLYAGNAKPELRLATILRKQRLDMAMPTTPLVATTEFAESADAREIDENTVEIYSTKPDFKTSFNRTAKSAVINPLVIYPIVKQPRAS